MESSFAQGAVNSKEGRAIKRPASWLPIDAVDVPCATLTSIAGSHSARGAYLAF